MKKIMIILFVLGFYLGTLGVPAMAKHYKHRHYYYKPVGKYYYQPYNHYPYYFPRRKVVVYPAPYPKYYLYSPVYTPLYIPTPSFFNLNIRL